jgi:hypothetical protein
MDFGVKPLNGGCVLDLVDEMRVVVQIVNSEFGMVY